METYLLCVKRLHRHKHKDHYEETYYRLVEANTLDDAKKKYKEWHNTALTKKQKIGLGSIIDATIGYCHKGAD